MPSKLNSQELADVAEEDVIRAAAELFEADPTAKAADGELGWAQKCTGGEVVSDVEGQLQRTCRGCTGCVRGRLSRARRGEKERQEETRAVDAAQWSGCRACKACSKTTSLTHYPGMAAVN